MGEFEAVYGISAIRRAQQGRCLARLETLPNLRRLYTQSATHNKSSLPVACTQAQASVSYGFAKRGALRSRTTLLKKRPAPPEHGAMAARFTGYKVIVLLNSIVYNTKIVKNCKPFIVPESEMQGSIPLWTK